MPTFVGKIAAILALATSTIVGVIPSNDILIIPESVNPPEIIEVKPIPKLPTELRAACACESAGYPNREPIQFKNGEPLKHFNKNGTTDYGACQINSIHLKNPGISKLDFINDKADNYAVAKIIYDRQGIKAFRAYNPETGGCLLAR